MKKLLALTAFGEAALGLVLVAHPPIVVRLLFNAELAGMGVVMGRVAGIALIALGLACRGKLPFVSTFGAFMTRAFDQIRMSQYSNANIKFVGSHAGVSIGETARPKWGSKTWPCSDRSWRV